MICFLTGNEDMHLKNFSLVVKDGVARLSPAYDLLNTTQIFGNASEESALPLRGKKRKLTRGDWVDYLCRERLGLPSAILDGILGELNAAQKPWERKISASYLSKPAQARYLEILGDRRARLFV